MHILARERNETNRDYALRTLKDNIIDLSLAPGTMLSENELGLQMGLSRTPVHEALMELSKIGLVEVYPQRGSVIALIDCDIVEETRFMRCVLEGAVVELACSMSTPADESELMDNVGLQEHYLAAGAADKVLALDNEFHHILFSIARKEQTWKMMNSFMGHFDRVRAMSITAVKDIKIVGDHRVIAEAVCKGDKETARKMMDKHLLRSKIDEIVLRENYPPAYFKSKA